MENKDRLIIERDFPTTIEKLWEVHTKPEHLNNWWKPVGFHMEVLEMNFEAGGRLHYRQYNDNGIEMFGIVNYLKIDEPNSMEFINGFSNEEGDFVRHPLAETWPLRLHNRLELSVIESGARLKLSCYPHEATEIEIQTFIGARKQVQGGFGGMMDGLEQYLTSL